MTLRFLAVCLVCCLTVWVRAEVPYALIRGRIVDDLAHAERANLPKVDALLAAMTPDGAWPDVDYANRHRTRWAPAAHLERLRTLAAAFGVPDSPRFRDPALRDALLRGLAHWHAAHPRCDNWWYNQIFAPQRLGETLLLAQNGGIPLEALPKGLLERWRAEGGDPTRKTGTTTGSNLVNIAAHCCYRALLTQDEPALRTALGRLFAPLAFTDAEGLQRDLSYHQHGPQLYLGNYGYDWLELNAAWLARLRGTDLLPPPERAALVPAYALGAAAEVEQGEAVARPGEAQPHAERVADGAEVRAVEAVVEAGGEIPVRGAGAQPYAVGRQVGDGGLLELVVFEVGQRAAPVLLRDGQVGVGPLEDAEAEQLKLDYGDALYEEPAADVAEAAPVCTLSDGRELKLAELNHIVGARAEEIVANVNAHFDYAKCDRKSLGAGMVIVGGASKLSNLTELLAEKCDIKVRKGALRQDMLLDVASQSKSADYLQILGLLYCGRENCVTVLPKAVDEPHDEAPEEEVKPVDPKEQKAREREEQERRKREEKEQRKREAEEAKKREKERKEKEKQEKEKSKGPGLFGKWKDMLRKAETLLDDENDNF